MRQNTRVAERGPGQGGSFLFGDDPPYSIPQSHLPLGRPESFVRKAAYTDRAGQMISKIAKTSETTTSNR